MLPNMRNLSSRRRRMSGGADESLAQGKNFAANMPGQMRQSGQMGGGNVYHGAPVLAGDSMLLDGDLRGKAGVEGLDASTAAIRGMQDGGSRRSRSRSNRRGRNNASARRSRSRRGRNNASARRSRRGRNNASARRSRNNAPARRNRKNASARRNRKNASARRNRKNASARRGRNNASARRGRNNVSARRKSSRRGRNNASARRNRSRRNQMGGDGEEEYMPEVYEDAVTPVQRRNGNSRNMYGGAHSLIPTQYAPVTQSPSLLSASAAARAGTAFSSDPFANGSGSA